MSPDTSMLVYAGASLNKVFAPLYARMAGAPVAQFAAVERRKAHIVLRYARKTMGMRAFPFY